MTCRNCEGAQWVCENHPDKPWDGMSSSAIACGCGAGQPCGVCNLELAAAGYVHAAAEKVARFVLSDVAEKLKVSGEKLMRLRDGCGKSQKTEARDFETASIALFEASSKVGADDHTRLARFALATEREAA